MLGGLGLLLKAQLNVKTKLCNSFQSFEYLDSTLLGVKSVRMIIVCRQPSSAANGPELLTPFQLSFKKNLPVCLKILLYPLVRDFTDFHLDDLNDLPYYRN